MWLILGDPILRGSRSGERNFRGRSLGEPTPGERNCRVRSLEEHKSGEPSIRDLSFGESGIFAVHFGV